MNHALPVLEAAAPKGCTTETNECCLMLASSAEAGTYDQLR